MKRLFLPLLIAAICLCTGRTVAAAVKDGPSRAEAFLDYFYASRGLDRPASPTADPGAVSGNDIAIACQHLKKAGVSPAPVATVTHDAKGKAKLSFKALEQALPFPVDTDQLLKDMRATPFAKDYNREILTVNNLPDDRYFILIDGTPVGDATAKELAAGIDLSGNPRTPQFQQAQRAWGLRRKATAANAAFKQALRPVPHTFELRPARTLFINSYESPEVEFSEFNLGHGVQHLFTAETLCTTEREHHTGKRALQVKPPAGKFFILSVQMFRLLEDHRRADELYEIGVPHTASLWMKASVTNASVEVCLGERLGGGRTVMGKKTTYTVGTEWTQLTHAFVPTANTHTRLQIVVRGAQGATWIDDIKVERGDRATPLVIGEPTLDPRCNGGFRYSLFQGDPSPCVQPPPTASSAIQGPLVRYTTITARDKTLPVRLFTDRAVTASLKDASGKTCWSETIQPKNGRAETTIPTKGLALGKYTFVAGDRTLGVTLAAEGPYVVRADRFRRVLERNGEMITGIGQGQGVNVYNMDDDKADGILQDVKKMGVRTGDICTCYAKIVDGAKVRKALDALARNGLYGFVEWDMCSPHSNPCHFCGRLCLHDKKSGAQPLDPVSCERIYAIIRDIKDHPAFLGNYFADEPTQEAAWKMRLVAEAIRDVDPLHPCFPNLNNALTMTVASDMMHELVMLDNYDRTKGGIYYSSRSVAAWQQCRPMWYYIYSIAGQVMMRRWAPEKMISQAYQVVINGTSLVFPYVYKPWENDLWMSWKTLSDELNEIQPAIAAETWIDGQTDNVGWSWRVTPEATYLLSAAVGDNEDPTAIPVPDGVTAAKTATVLFENRTVPLIRDADGRLAIRDTFPYPTRHVYKMAR